MNVREYHPGEGVNSFNKSEESRPDNDNWRFFAMLRMT